jgi:putative membrane-bound dehydrogenase-like protein
MVRSGVIGVVGLFGLGAASAPARAGTGAGGEAEIPFKVPAGFTVRQVAGAALVRHPMFACFDERGRLYVADSAGTNPTGPQLTVRPPHRIRRLDDTDGDGRFDKSIVFADRLTYPQGVLWYEGAVYTASPPSLWRLEDTDGDGKADRRDELVTGWKLTGVADELHGPNLGPDGRIYWFCGRFPHEIRRPGGPVLRRGRAPLVLRCRADGRDVEFISGAQGNPVEAVFTDEGEPLVCGTWSGSAGARQDVLIHCVEGGDYPVLDGDFGEHKHTGGLLPPLTQLGVAAASGAARSRGASFPPAYRGNVFSALYNMHKVMRHVIDRDGATFRCRDEDFLTSDEPDFHPTDVVEDADGSLLVVDTGNWFRHCPTSRVGAAPVQGGIYRIEHVGVRPQADPRGLSIDWQRLDPDSAARWLDDPRFAVRDRAVATLARQGERALPALAAVLRDGPPATRCLALWTLARIGTPAARAAVRSALGDRAMAVRLTAATVAGLLRDRDAAPRLMERVRSDPVPAVRRQAASALGRLGTAAAVPALLDGLRGEADRFLEHALLYALIVIGDRQATLPGLRDPDPRVRRGALIALDQMEGGGLALEQVVPLLSDPDAACQQAALRVATERPEWAGPMAATLRAWLDRDDLGDSHRDSLLEALVAFHRAPAVRDLVASRLRRESTSLATRILLLDAMARAPLDRLPALWLAELRWCLDHPDDRIAGAAVVLLRASGTDEFDAALLTLARTKTRPVDARLDALAAVAPRLKRLEPPLADLLLGCLRPDQPPLRRLAAASALGQVPLDARALDALADAVATAGPMELPRLLPAFERSPRRDLGLKLASALERSPGLPSLSFEALERVLRAYPPEVNLRIDPVRMRLRVAAQQQSARLAELVPLLSQGDPAEGRAVFFGQKAACTTCHAIESQGGHVGPDLSHIGAIRSGRDLLEAIVLPSASFARGFEPYTIATHDGRTYTGVIVRESSALIELVTADRSIVRLPRPAIDLMDRSPVSIMPKGLDAQLTRQELADLIAFLRGLR